MILKGSIFRKFIIFLYFLDEVIDSNDNKIIY
jgi:hypothetical protein